MIGYAVSKVQINDQESRKVLVTLEMPDDDINFKSNLHRKNIVDATKATYRCNKAKVLKIEDNQGKEYLKATTLCYFDKKLKYIVGEELEEKNYNEYDNEIVHGEGIHFCLDKEVALSYALYRDGIKDGLYQEWCYNGQKSVECTFKDGELNGLYQSWWDDGQKLVECTYIHGKKEGLYQKWHENGQKWDECTYRHGKKEGLYQLWYMDGETYFKTNYNTKKPC